MKIYYAMSISGGYSKDIEAINIELIKYLKEFGEVLTEHFSNPELIGVGEKLINDKEIHDRDMDWIFMADVIIAEVSNPSLGVGYEIGRGVENNKKILCLRKKSDKRLSAMVSGCEKLTLEYYDNLTEAKNVIGKFIELNFHKK